MLTQHQATICCGKIHLRDHTIRAQIMAGISSVSTAMLALISITAMVNIFVLGGNTKILAATALEEQIRTNALNFSKAYAQEISQTLRRRGAAVQTVATATAHAYFADPWEFIPTNTSVWSEDVASASDKKSHTQSDGKTRYTTELSSSYYIPKTRKQNNSYGCILDGRDEFYNLGEDMGQDRPGCYGLEQRLDGDSAQGKSTAARHARDRSAVLDTYFMQYYKSMPDLHMMYVGFEDSGLFRQYPGGDSYFTTAAHPGTYDPRKRPWYIQARLAAAPENAAAVKTKTPTGNVLGPISVSAPYKDYTTGIWMITVVQAIFDPANNDELVAVVGFDISIDAIQKHIVDEVKFLEGGVVALVESNTRDRNDDRYLVAHVDFTALSGTDAESPPFFGEAEPEIHASATIYRKLFSGNGSTEVMRNSNRESAEKNYESFLLAYTTIKVPHGYTVITIVPEKEALKPIESMTQMITSTEVSVSVSVLAITSITAGLVLLLVRAIAGRIAKPVTTMVHVAQNIVSGAAEKDLAKNLGVKYMKSLETYAQVKDRHGKDVSDQDVRNEMISLVRSFLAMTQGLKKDSNRAKTRIVQPKNPYYVREEHELITALQEVDDNHWGSQRNGSAPVPKYAVAIAEAVPVDNTVAQSEVPIATVAPMAPATKF